MKSKTGFSSLAALIALSLVALAGCDSALSPGNSVADDQDTAARVANTIRVTESPIPVANVHTMDDDGSVFSEASMGPRVWEGKTNGKDFDWAYRISYIHDTLGRTFTSGMKIEVQLSGNPGKWIKAVEYDTLGWNYKMKDALRTGAFSGTVAAPTGQKIVRVRLSTWADPYPGASFCKQKMFYALVRIDF